MTIRPGGLTVGLAVPVETQPSQTLVNCVDGFFR